MNSQGKKATVTERYVYIRRYEAGDIYEVSYGSDRGTVETAMAETRLAEVFGPAVVARMHRAKGEVVRVKAPEGF